MKWGASRLTYLRKKFNFLNNSYMCIYIWKFWKILGGPRPPSVLTWLRHWLGWDNPVVGQNGSFSLWPIIDSGGATLGPRGTLAPPKIFQNFQIYMHVYELFRKLNFFLKYVSLLAPHFIKILIYIYINRINREVLEEWGKQRR